MHGVPRETRGWSESTRETVEDARLPDSSLESSPLILSIASGTDDCPEVVSVFLGVRMREILDVDVGVIRSRVRILVVRPE